MIGQELLPTRRNIEPVSTGRLVCVQSYIPMLVRGKDERTIRVQYANVVKPPTYFGVGFGSVSSGTGPGHLCYNSCRRWTTAQASMSPASTFKAEGRRTVVDQQNNEEM